jgi:hypothetical protein
MTSALAESTAQTTAQNKWYYHVGPYTCQTTLWVTGLVRVQGVSPFPATMKILWAKLVPFTSSKVITVYCLLFSLFTSYYPTSK